MKTTLITAAFKQEVRGIRESLHFLPAETNPNLFECIDSNRKIFLLLTGMGPEKSRAALEENISRLNPDLIINLGTAGSLVDSIKPLSVFVPSAFIEKDSNALCIAPEILEYLQSISLSSGLRSLSGTLFTSVFSVSSKNTRAEIARDFSAQAVDMEAYPQALIAGNNHIPFGSLKIISDNAKFPAVLFYIMNLHKINRLLCDITRHL